MENKKESASMLEHARQIHEDSEPIILTEKQQYCVAKHLQAYLKLANNDRNFKLPCRFCKYLNLCTDDFQWDIMNQFSRKTGVELSQWKGFKIEDIPEFLRE